VEYHSGEVFTNTPWTGSLAGGAITWRTPQTFAQNPNSSALRWATLYNFRFDASSAPGAGVNVSATIGLFKPGTPASLVAALPATCVPGTGACRADFDNSGAVDVQDYLAYLRAYAVADPRADIDSSGRVTVQDFLAYLQLYSAGCP
jgi:hypothetical protein